MGLEHLAIPEKGETFEVVKEFEEKFYYEHKDIIKKNGIISSVGAAQEKGYYLRLTVPQSINQEILKNFPSVYDFMNDMKQKISIPVYVKKK